MSINWKLLTGLIIAVFVLMGLIGNLIYEQQSNYSKSNDNNHLDELHTFESFYEFEEYLNSTASYKYWGNTTNYGYKERYVDDADSDGLSFEPVPEAGSSDYSTTNIQVEGVDEGDIVKNDGKYAYIVSQNKTEVFILEVNPASKARIISEIEMNYTINEIYLNNNKLIAVGSIYSYFSYYEYYDYRDYGSESNTIIEIYDITTKSEPILVRYDRLNGSLINSRMIGNYFYVIVKQPLRNINTEDDLPAPPSKIHYINNSTDNYYTFTNIISINVKQSNLEPSYMIILLGSSNNIYVSTKNIFITCTRYERYNSHPMTDFDHGEFRERTIIIRISIKNGVINYQASGSVPGYALNRFSMDEYKEHFRIATTTGHVSRLSMSTSENHVYVLDMDLNIVGGLREIAPGERIYSARFMGNRGYLVTFKKVDPFFVIDLSIPYNPRILGELKIPGYSNYLHLYDENHVIGIGKETVEADGGEFAWYQGVKISLFDVTNVQNPKERSKFIIGDRGTESEALYDPRAFLFSKNKQLLVIPIQLAEIDESKYPNGAAPNTHGEYTWCGAYVFKLSSYSGIKLRGRITHLDDNELTYNGNDYYSLHSSFYSKKVKRSFYIEDVLYTVSDYKLKANNLDDLDEISSVDLLNENTTILKYYD